MITTVNKAICLHAQADDLKFLNPFPRRLEKIIGDRLNVKSFGDQNSKYEARLALEKSENSFVIILAHGGTDYIRGGEYIHRVTREIVEGEKFLTSEDVRVFEGKVVFCLSCNSNGLARLSLAAGAVAFVGFDDIPFNRFDSDGNAITNREFQQHAQKLILASIQSAIERFVATDLTLREAVDFLRLSICRGVVEFVRGNAAFKQRREVAALVLRVKDGVFYHGRSNVVFTK